MSSVRPCSSKTREDDDATEDTEDLERGKLHGVYFYNTILKVYYENMAPESPTPSYMQPLKYRKKDSI